MAGGALAAESVCLTCFLSGDLVKASRVYEGVEDDHYLCERGHTFGIDWARGPATEPQWPPSAEHVALAERMRTREP